MKASKSYFSLWIALWAMVHTSTLSATAIFSDEAVNVWVVDPSNQTTTTYSIGQWTGNYNELNGFSANAPLQILVNGLPQSSVPMSPMQPGISIIGLGTADINSTTYSGPGMLFMHPASASGSETIEVLLQVSESVAQQGGGEILWTINGGPVSSSTITPSDSADESGFITKRFYLVANGTYDVLVTLLQNGQPTVEKRATYTINNADPLGDKRDTDGDGIPDRIEAQIGLDPLSADLFEDTNGDGWSEFDVWLRCEEVNITDCAIPADSDGDGWSDFDEKLRGTNPNDFVLPRPEGEEQDEAYLQSKLLLQEKPAARRLYEIEYLLSGDLGDSDFSGLQAAQLDGTELFNLQQLVSAEQLSSLGVDASQLTENILLSNAEQKVGNAQWPKIRVAASRTLAFRATKPVVVTGDTVASQNISLLMLEGAGDLNFKDFPNTQNGEWDTPEEWREALREWLASELVINQYVPFSDEETRNGLLFEASLREEARLLQESEQVLLGAQSLPREWVNELQVAMQQREEKNLFDWYLRISQTLSDNSAYQDMLSSITSFIGSMPEEGTNTSEWFNARLLMPVEPDAQGCFISAAELSEIQQDPDYFAQWQLECPMYYTESDLTQWLQEAKTNRYLLRMLMFNEGAERITESVTLGIPGEDTDNDTISNAVEVLQSQFDLTTYPWRADSDGDDVYDNLDQCPNDILNTCSGDPNQPQLQLGTDIQMELGDQGAVALLQLVLSSPALTEISFTYHIEAIADQGDNAVDGVDFVASKGTLQFLPGQQSMLIPAYLLANEATGTTRFRIRIADLVGASLGSDDNSQLISVIRSAVNPPELCLVATELTVDERQSIVFDASLSESGIDDPSLSFVWQQISGPSVSITDPESDMPGITAPETYDVAVMVFSVTAFNAEGEESSDTVTVIVNPVDDPPVIISEATFTVSRNETLSISKDELLANVSEPDGEALSVSQLVSSVGNAGELIETASTFEFTPTSKGGSETIQLEENPLDITQWINNGVAYRTAQFNENENLFRIHTWTPENGARVVAESDQSYSGLVTDLAQQILYISRYDSDTQSTWIEWVLPDGTRGELDTGNYASLFGAQKNSLDGTLYHCIDSQWQLINPTTSSSQSINLGCNRYASGQALIENKFCLTADDGLYCSEDGLNFEARFKLPENANFDRIFTNEAGTLVLYNDSNNQFLVAVDGQTDGQVLHTFENYFNQIQGVWIDSVFYTVIPVKQNDIEEGVQLYKWQAGADTLVPVGESVLFSDQISRQDLSNLVQLRDNLLWYGQKNLYTYGKYLINPLSGTFTQIGVDYAGPRQLKVWNDSILFSTDINEGTCQWFVLDAEGAIDDAANPELAEASCYGQLVYGSTLAYTLYDPELEQQSFFAKYAVNGPSSAQFLVRITDENDNSVDLPVRIQIVEEVE